MTVKFTDAASIMDIGDVKETSAGLIAVARTMRAGVQIYAGYELNRPDLDYVRVYRPESEVFSDRALASFAHAPLTNDHPPEFVTPENWKDYAVGEVSNQVKRDGDWVVFPLIFKDKSAIDDIKAGKRELSAGYSSNIVWGKGVSPKGEEYDATQTLIDGNHVSLVDAARAGMEARVGDKAAKWGPSPLADYQPKKETQPMIKVTVKGIQIEANDQAASAINSLLSEADETAKVVDRLNAQIVELTANRDREIATRDAEIDKLKASMVSDEAIMSMVADRSNVIAQAKSACPDVDFSKIADTNQIRREVVKRKVGEHAVTDCSNEYVKARFDAMFDGKDNADKLATILSAPATLGTPSMHSLDADVSAAREAYHKFLQDRDQAKK